MKADSFILAALQTLPDHTITGKKRLQKFGMLLQFGGLEIDADFSLHHYGPYSFELAEAAEELYWSGAITENAEQTGVFRTFQSNYVLTTDSEPPDELPEPHKERLLKLNEFSTIELEVASTIALFEREGADHKAAIAKTRSLKRAKAIPKILAKAEKILEIVS